MKKKKKNNNVKFIVILILAILLLIYIVYAIINLIINPTATFLVENGKISFEETVQGYIIRDETVIKGQNYKNGISEIKSEGEKVAKGEAIFRYYTNGEEGLLQKISELDIKIREAMEKENDIYNGDIRTLESQIHKKIYEVSGVNNLQTIKESKTELNNIITKKAKIAGEKSPSGSYLKQLIDERSTYENQLNSGSEYLTATRSGVVSYRVDGLEQVLTPSNLASLSKSMLKELKIKTGEIVATNEESGKIIDNFYCDIACILPNENLELANIKVGSNLKIRLSNFTELTGKVEYIVAEDENESIVVFKIDKCVEDLINYRKISFDIIWWSASGLKVPNSAIKYEDDIAYIIRKRVGYTDNIYVKVLKQNENYSIIENYTRDELIEKGISKEKLNYRKTISLYDELES
ncbi:MAG: hypothetical protein HFJ41_05200 [Clostridia bacterium]|nr:hypothetical protein [Clostridia bacterium]